MSTLSRRSFLKGTVAAGAAATAGFGFPSIITAQSKDPVKIGVQIGRASCRERV